MTPPPQPLVLGIAVSHGGGAVLMRGRHIIAAIPEERLTRIKKAPLVAGAQSRAVDAVLAQAGVGPEDLDLVVACALHDGDLGGPTTPSLKNVPTQWITHHLGHAWSAFIASGEAAPALLVMDGMGSGIRALPADAYAVAKGPILNVEARETASLWQVVSGVPVPLEVHIDAHPDPSTFGTGPIRMPAVSLGTLMQSAAQSIFGHWTASGTVMGLAALGQPDRATHPDAHLRVGSDGRLEFPLAGARIAAGLAPWPDNAQAHADLAASVQDALELGVLHLAQRLRGICDADSLCLAGGVALNGLANERVIRASGFARVHTMPAAEDGGTAFGAAAFGVHHLVGPQPWPAWRDDAFGPPLLHEGPSEITGFNPELIADLADEFDLSQPDDIPSAAAKLIARNLSLAWVQGPAGYGPRALGQRVLVGDPRAPGNQGRFNALKRREAFRPFAPAVLAEHAPDWFATGSDRASPWMQRVVSVRPERRAQVPAIVHKDGTTRPQTVPQNPSPARRRWRRLLEAFYEETGVPMVLATSLNGPNTPIAFTAADGLEVVRTLGIDAFALGPWLGVRRGTVP